MNSTASRDDSNNNPLTSSVTWQPPPDGIMKINVDAAFCNLDSTAQLGVVIRDSRGDVNCSAVVTKHFILSVLVGELEAILFGLDIAREMGFNSILLETDCQVAVKEIHKLGTSLLSCGNLVEILKPI
ncbi:hypothetical protein REPUB_Repub12eG0083500 [Reevesia pubescens]